MKSKTILLSLLTLLAATCHALEPEFKIENGVILLDAGAMGKFRVAQPVVALKAGGRERGMGEVTSPNELRIRYPNGATLNMTVNGTKLSGHFTNASAIKSFIFRLQIPMKYKGFGRFGFDESPMITFPAEPDKVHIQHGGFRVFTLIDSLDRGFILVTPGGYQGVQDNRPKNWGNSFFYNYQFDTAGKDEGYFQFKLKPLAKGASENANSQGVEKKFIADRYGQSYLIDFPEKVKSDEELKADAAEQLALIPAFESNPNLDAFGGIKSSDRGNDLEATGFFYVAEVDGRQVLVTPEGNIFFQLSVCGIANADHTTKVAGREGDFEWLPKKNDPLYRNAWQEGRPDWGNFSFYIANWIRKFGKPYSYEAWSGQVVDRLRSWGFNSAGAFSQISESMKAKGFPYVKILPLNRGKGIKLIPDRIGPGYVLDPFAPDAEASISRAFAKSVAPSANDPLLIGYFLGNEQHFEDLPKLIPRYKASQVPAKAKLVQILKDKYKTINAFNASWKPAEPFQHFEELEDAPLFVRSEEAAADMQDFFRLFMETYYSLVERVFRQHDPNHLLIGNRWTPNTANNKTVVEIGGKYLDVISINYYTYGIDAAFLEKVYEWSGQKPMILSEWYYSCGDRGLTASKAMANQEERGKAYRNYLEQSAALPFVIGSQWFIYTDQALTGRFFEGYNGEGNNTGFVDVTDRPYDELVEAAKSSHDRIYDVMFGLVEPYAYDDPAFNSNGAANKVVLAPRALPGMKLDGTTRNWPGRPAEIVGSDRIVLGNLNPDLQGAFRASWDEEHLYLLVQIKDATPMKNKQAGDKLWKADCVELFIGTRSPDETGGMIYGDYQILIGASTTPRIAVVGFPHMNEAINVIGLKDVTGDGYSLELSIPWEILEVTPTTGTELLFDLVIDNSDDGQRRVQQLAWNGTSQNSGDRAAWGRLKLVVN